MVSPAAAIVKALNALKVPSFGVTGIGVDIVDIAILQGLLTTGGEAFVDAAWTEVEQRDAADTPERLAARWAAKEAVMKALGRGLGDVDPLDVEVVRAISGALEVRLRDSAAEAAQQADVGSVHVSMSHEQGWAVGFAIATSRSCEECSEDHQLAQTERGTDDR